VALEREKDQETQIETDAAHQRQIEKVQALGCSVVAWRPPVGSKDIAEAWQTGALPDAHHPMTHTRQGGGGAAAAAKLPQPRQQQVQTSTPTPFD
jgi:hypothetical protein